jgi:hypothetical protein
MDAVNYIQKTRNVLKELNNANTKKT